MAKVASSTETGTRDRILDVAQRLIQLRGYSAFSYADIAQALGIRKASIHYYFPAKADLGAAVIERYAGAFEGAMTGVAGTKGMKGRDMVEAYFTPFVELADDPDLVCLCGALAGELTALPRAMRVRLKHFFSFHQKWLAQVLTVGLKRKEFQLPSSPVNFARMIVNLLQGALLIRRVTGDNEQLFGVIEIVRMQLAPRGSSL